MESDPRPAKEPALPFAQRPALRSALRAPLTAARDRRSAPRRLRLLCGARFARGRRTVTSWSRAAGSTDDCRRASSALRAAGRRADELACRRLRGPLAPLLRLAPGDHLLFGRDDTPTPRYGPCVPGAGVHHNPSPGPAGEPFVSGHVGVTRAWRARHPLGHTRSLPPRALRYVRNKDVPKSAKAYPWDCRTERELAAALVGWRARWLRHAGKALGLAADGASAQRPSLKPALALGGVVFRRLRQDARRWDLPPAQRRPGPRGPRPTDGKGRIDRAQRTGPQRGWQRVECVPYGERQVQAVQTFAATGRPAGGRIRVARVREPDGWLASCCTDPAVSAATVPEVMADRGAIEQTFKDVQGVWGAGQQQVRNGYAGLGAFAVNLLWYSVVEVWAWARRAEGSVDRCGAPWDTEERRPSHADKRKALQREALREEIQTALGTGPR